MSTSLMYAPRRIFAGLLAGVLAVAGLAVAAGPASAADATRVFGETRVETSVATALEAHEGADLDTVVLATSAVAADSLPGNALAGALDAALLLTEPDNLNPAVADALATLTPETVILLGGTAALTTEVAEDLEALNYTVDRIGGEDRYETSALIADRIAAEAADGGEAIAGGFGGTTTVLVTRGDLPFDAVAASSLSYYGPHPVLLTKPTVLSPEVAQAITDLGADNAVILGGSAAVSPDVQDDIEAITGLTERIEGGDRNATAVALATALIAGDFDVSTTYIATGAKPYDSLTAGQLAGQTADPSPILLTAGENLSEATTAFLEMHAADIDQLVVFGGAGAVPDDVVEAAIAASGGAPTAFDVTLSWVNEVNATTGAFGNGEPGATGTATVTLDPAQDEIDFSVDYRDVTGPFDLAPGFHIHEGALTENGPIVVTLATGAELETDDDQVLAGTVTADEVTEGDLGAIIDAILANPEGYYLNLHSNDFPGGAIRGQLPDGAQDEVYPLATEAAEGDAFSGEVLFVDTDNDALVINDTAGATTGLSRLSYADGDTFLYEGAPSSLADFEQALSVGDVVDDGDADSYSTTDPNTFNLAVDADDETAPTATGATFMDGTTFGNNPVLDELFIEFDGAVNVADGATFSIDADADGVGEATTYTCGDTVVCTEQDADTRILVTPNVDETLTPDVMIDSGVSTVSEVTSVTDAAGNAATGFPVVISIPDTTAPTLTAGGTADAPTFVADEDLDEASLDVTDVTTSGDETVSSVTLDEDGRTILVTLSDALEVGDSVTLTANSVEDLAGNPGPAADVVLTIPDTTAPTLTAGGTADAPTFIADEDLDAATVELADVTIDSDGETVTSVTWDAASQTILVAVSDALEDTESVTLAAASVEDLAGNPGPEAAVTFTAGPVIP